jgi:hypothetical protein
MAMTAKALPQRTYSAASAAALGIAPRGRCLQANAGRPRLTSCAPATTIVVAPALPAAEQRVGGRPVARMAASMPPIIIEVAERHDREMPHGRPTTRA